MSIWVTGIWMCCLTIFKCYFLEEVEEERPQQKEEQPQNTKLESPKSIVQWQVDLNYKREQERLKIPSNPEEWYRNAKFSQISRIHLEIFRSAVHVRHWVQWAVRQFNLINIKLSDWSMTGQELHNLTIQDFQKIVPNDPGDVFWTHLELLRKMKVVGKF